MTDEEMAEERVTKFTDINFNDPDNYGSAKEVGHFSYYAGFLAGLEAGRLKWHDLRKDPKDLPKDCGDGTHTSDHVWVQFTSDNTGVCYYDWDMYGWYANGYPEPLTDIIAWCEIPKFNTWINENEVKEEV